MTNNKTKANLPLYALIATCVFIVAAVVLAIFSDPGNQSTLLVLGLIASTLPSLVASFFAERTSRDVRNGVLAEKVKEGAAQAIEEQGVIVRDGPVVQAELRALSALLAQNTRVTETNTQHLIEVDGENG